MRAAVPLRVTVRLDFEAGPAAGERRYRLSEALEWPPCLRFAAALPLAGTGAGRVTFLLPGGGEPIACAARLVHDPEHPERGSRAELGALTDEQRAALEAYGSAQDAP